MTTKNRTLIAIGIMCVALTDSGGGATAPALQSIAMAFPNAPLFAIQMISTVPQLLLALVPLLYAKLLDYGVRKRLLMYIGSFCFVLGGMAPVLLHGSIYTVLIARAIFGLGNGFLMPISVDLVVDFFEGDKRNKMQGFVQCFMGISGILFGLLGGILCGIHWTYTFLSYGAAAVFCIIALVLVPEPDRKGKIASQEGISDIKERARLTGGVYAVTILFGVYFMFWMAIATTEHSSS
jgi:MFS family permease